MSNYDAQVMEYDVIDHAEMERQWRGTITNGEVTFSFVLKDYGIGYDFEENNEHRLLLYKPDGRRVYWSHRSNSKDAKTVKATVREAIRKSEALYRLVYLAEGEPDCCGIAINPDSLVYEDEYIMTVYPRRADGSVDVDGRKEVAKPLKETI